MSYTRDFMQKEISVTSKMFYFMVPPVLATFRLWCKLVRAYESLKVAFSGLRGGIAFGMIYSLQIPNRIMYIQTTLIIIFFTVFIQGSSVGPLLNFLKGTRHNILVITLVD